MAALWTLAAAADNERRRREAPEYTAGHSSSRDTRLWRLVRIQRNHILLATPGTFLGPHHM